MSELVISGLNELNDRLEQLLQRAPQMRRELHEQIGNTMRAAVRRNLKSSLGGGGRNHNHRGHHCRDEIAGWQEKYVGSRGGYAAVRAVDSSTGPRSPGAITNYLENGHKVRGSRGDGRTAGLYFYAKTRLTIRGDVQTAAQAFAAELAAMLEG